MADRNQGSNMEIRKVQMELQEREIIDLFKTQGGMVTAKKENLRLLATLPFEPELVKEGDEGDISLLDNDELPITQEFDKMVDEIVKLTERETLPLSHNKKRISQAG